MLPTGYESSSHNPALERHQKRAGFVPNVGRTCTDVVFLVLFALFWLGMIAVSVMAFTDGEVERLMYGKNYLGDVCGVDDYGEKQYLWWRESKMVTARRWTDLQAVCVSDCPTAGDVIYTDGEICTAAMGCEVTISTESYHYRCFPRGAKATWLPGYLVAWDNVAGVDAAVYSGMGDARNSMGVILLSGGLLSFLWAISLQTVWKFQFNVQGSLYGYVAGAFVSLIVLCVAFITRYLIDIGGRTSEGLVDINIFCFSIFVLITVVYGILVGQSWTLYTSGSVIVEVASHFLDMIPGLFAFVTVMAVLLMWFFSYWIDVAAFICSSEVMIAKHAQSLAEFDAMAYDDDEVTVMTTVTDGRVTSIMWFWFFGLLWTSEFLLTFTITVIAGAVSETFYRPGFLASDKWTVCNSVMRTVRYSLGTISFGSFFIVILWPFRLVGGLFYSVLKRQQFESNIVKVLCCSCICSAWCFDQCVKYTNKIAFTVVGMKGLPFCSSSRMALAALDFTDAKIKGNFVVLTTETLFIAAKLVIATVCAIVAWLWCGYRENIETPLFPVLLTLLLAYMCANVVLQLFQATLETIFVAVGLTWGQTYEASLSDILKLLVDLLQFGHTQLGSGQILE